MAGLALLYVDAAPALFRRAGRAAAGAVKFGGVSESL